MSVIDFDALFQQHVISCMQAHKGEFTEAEWEEKIVQLYQEFVQTPLEDIGLSPIAYFKAKSPKELVADLKAYVEQDVSVPDVLLDALIQKGYTLELAGLLVEDNERLQLYAVELLQADKRIIQSYFYILKNKKYSNIVKAAILEQLEKVVSKIKQPLYKLLSTAGEEYAIELLIKAGEKNDILYNTIVKGYRSGKNKLLYLKFLGDLGDTRALQFLYDDIAREEIGYIEFKEMKYTIEQLGGSYDIIRNFSFDEDYKAIQIANQKEEELRSNSGGLEGNKND